MRLLYYMIFKFRVYDRWNHENYWRNGYFNNAYIRYSRGRFSFHWNIPTGLGGNHSYLWISYANGKNYKHIWGDLNPGKRFTCSFTFIILNVIELNTIEMGKKLFGRLYINKLFKKDYEK